MISNARKALPKGSTMFQAIIADPSTLLCIDVINFSAQQKCLNSLVNFSECFRKNTVSTISIISSG